MIYPNNFENKVGFSEIRKLLKERCLSSLGKEQVDLMVFSADADLVNEKLSQVREFRRLQESDEEFPMQYFFDVRQAITRVRLPGTHLEENEVWDLRRSLETIAGMVKFLHHGDEETDACPYPALHRMTEGVTTFPWLVRRADSILDKFGKIKDSASMTLAGIRHELAKTEGSISRTLYTILHAAQKDGLVDKDVAPTMRDGRLVIPVAPGLKRKINGIVHDESATGRTVFVEPAEVVEANNKVRQLEAEERREIIRILTLFTDEVRPNVQEILNSYQFLAQVDFVYAKAELAKLTNSFEPEVRNEPLIDWTHAIHPLLQLSLAKQSKQVVPLDISLQRILIISGPNAGGKSVCLKTVGLLQYMLQCGLPVPIADRSQVGIFSNIMIDIGDEQSIENDLSTYSSHLMNMKQMMRHANPQTLLLIDEFGGGTEPTIGGAIAEAVLKQFWLKQTFGVITTHYQNLKHFAEDHEGVVNGAMLYDRHEMQALFQLSIGQPGSSFAIEIARKTGIPEEVIADASDIVGRDYIQSDKYLQDIVRDQRYWENKRQTIHQHEKRLEVRGERLDATIEELENDRKNILRHAKEQAEELLRETNRRIENAIREIRESQAEKEATRRIREELNTFKQEVADIDTKADDEKIARKIAQIQARKKRKEEKREKAAHAATQGTDNETRPNAHHTPTATAETAPLAVGDSVRIKGLSSVGDIEKIDGKMATVIFGEMRTKMRIERLEKADRPAQQQTHSEERNERIALLNSQLSQQTRSALDSHKLNFKQDLDVRGMRGDEALNAVTYFIDDAILVGAARVRILHGKGNGILRQLIRQYLHTVPGVAHYADEHVQFGGAGITVVDLE